MKTEKGHWVKYSNRIFPKYERKLFLIEVKPKTFIGFHNFENAVIYEKLMEIQKDLEQDKGVKDE